MFKNPIKKYQSGGQITEEQATEQMASALSQAFGMDKDAVKARIQEIRSNEEESAMFAEGLKLIQAGKQQEGLQIIGQLFAKPKSAKQGGKIDSFVCKHAKRGHLAGCDCKEDGGKVKKAQYGEIVNDSTGKRRVIYHPEGGYAGYVDLTTGKAYNHNDEEMLQPGWYNGKGYPMAHRNATRGNAYEVNTYGRIIENLPEGNQRVLPPADSANFAGLVKQWDMSKIGHAVTAEQNGGVVKAQGGKKVFNLIHQKRDGNVYQSHQYGNPEGHPDNNWTYERLITPQQDTLIRRSSPNGYSFMMSSKNPTQEIVTYTPTGELRAVQDYKTRAKWTKENSFHDSADYPVISTDWISPGSIAQ